MSANFSCLLSKCSISIRENLHYQWKRAVRIAGFPHNSYRGCKSCRETLQFLQPFFIDSADFPCRGPAFSNPHSFYGQNICSICSAIFFIVLLGNHQHNLNLILVVDYNPDTYQIVGKRCLFIRLLSLALAFPILKFTFVHFQAHISCTY